MIIIYGFLISGILSAIDCVNLTTTKESLLYYIKLEMIKINKNITWED